MMIMTDGHEKKKMIKEVNKNKMLLPPYFNIMMRDQLT